MRFIQEWGYTVKIGEEGAHQQWLTEHDAEIRAATPAGMTYIGTFAVIFSSEKQAGGYRMLYELDSYGAMDTGAAANKDPGSPWGRLVRDWGRFVETDLAAPWSNGLLKNVIDATIWDPPTD
jgi:hypothetical protein